MLSAHESSLVDEVAICDRGSDRGDGGIAFDVVGDAVRTNCLGSCPSTFHDR